MQATGPTFNAHIESLLPNAPSGAFGVLSLDGCDHIAYREVSFKDHPSNSVWVDTIVGLQMNPFGSDRVYLPKDFCLG